MNVVNHAVWFTPAQSNVTSSSRHAELAGQQLGRPLHAVAEPDDAHAEQVGGHVGLILGLVFLPKL